MKMPNTVKTRNHYVLFAKDTPFRARVEKNKKAYSRKHKHQSKGW